MASGPIGTEQVREPIVQNRARSVVRLAEFGDERCFAGADLAFGEMNLRQLIPIGLRGHDRQRSIS
jgi:hypothetical protein